MYPLYPFIHYPCSTMSFVSLSLISFLSLQTVLLMILCSYLCMYMWIDRQTDRQRWLWKKTCFCTFVFQHNCFALFPYNEKKICKVWMAIKIPNLPSRLPNVATAQKLCRTVSYSFCSNRTPKQGSGTEEKGKGQNLVLEWNVCCVVHCVVPKPLDGHCFKSPLFCDSSGLVTWDCLSALKTKQYWFFDQYRMTWHSSRLFTIFLEHFNILKKKKKS